MFSTQVDVPTGSDLLAHLGWGSDVAIRDQANLHVEAVAVAARSYCRGRGWEKDAQNQWTCPEDVAVVIISAAARSLSNPEASVRVEAGSFNAVPGNFGSWSLVESFILNGYRLRAG